MFTNKKFLTDIKDMMVSHNMVIKIIPRLLGNNLQDGILYQQQYQAIPQISYGLML